MREIRHTCDKCRKEIPGDVSNVAGGSTLVVLTYHGLMGNNNFPDLGWHLHYECAIPVIRTMRKLIEEEGDKHDK